MGNKFLILMGGSEEGNWMDLRDMIVKHLQECETELKFEKIISGLILSFCPNPEQVIEGRKAIGMKVSKKDEKQIKKMYKEMKNE